MDKQNFPRTSRDARLSFLAMTLTLLLLSAGLPLAAQGLPPAPGSPLALTFFPLPAPQSPLQLSAAPDALPPALTGAEKAGTTLLSIPVAAKIAFPVALAAQAALSHDQLQNPLLLCALWTLPNSFLLANVIEGNAGGTRLWRRISLGADLVSFAAMLGIGIAALNDPDGMAGWGDLIGVIFIAYSVPFGVAGGLDLIPFPVEKRLR